MFKIFMLRGRGEEGKVEHADKEGSEGTNEKILVQKREEGKEISGSRTKGREETWVSHVRKR